MTLSITNGMAASLVLGQSDFTKSDPTPSPPTPNRLNSPLGLAVDPTSGKVFISDRANHRVLRFATLGSLTNGAAAEAVLGQPDFAHATQSATAKGMNYPFGLAVDQEGRLWVADSSNNRVLRFDNAANKPNGGDADGVLGQPAFGNAGGALSRSGMQNPFGVSVDPAGRLWVAEYENNRILRFDNAASKSNGADADGVLGQANFGDKYFPDPPSASSLYFPTTIHADSFGRLWVADHGNNRVLRFDNAATKPNGANADAVLAQADFTKKNQDQFASARWLTYDNNTNCLFVVDLGHNRVLVFNNAPAKANGAAPDAVIGQTDFTTYTSGISATKLNGAFGASFDPVFGVLWVFDIGINRVLMFGTPSFPINLMPASLVLGTSNFTSTGNLGSPRSVTTDPATGKVFVTDTFGRQVLRYASANSLTSGATPEASFGEVYPFGVSVDAGGRLWVADGNGNRVVRFDNAANRNSTSTPDGVLGQTNYSEIGAATSRNGMRNPQMVFADSRGHLWVSDLGNHRILRFDDAVNKPNGANADGVLGQPDFTSGGSGSSPNQLNQPNGIYVDSNRYLWVADKTNNRVLRFDNAEFKNNGSAADGVLGQVDFAHYLPATTRNGMDGPQGLSGDNTGRLFVADSGNHRVLVFNNAATKTNGANADNVFGQTNFTSNQSGTSATKLSQPYSNFFDAKTGILWQADTGNGRVLRFDIPAIYMNSVNALDFDGVDDYVDCGAGFPINQAFLSMTVEFWYKTSVGTGAYQQTVGRAYTTWEIQFHQDGTINFYLNSHGHQSSAQRPLDGNWHHLAVTYDDTANEIKYYIDGVQLGSTISTGESIPSNNNPLNIGRRSVYSGEFFKGQMDEVRIWNVARTQTQIQSNMMRALSPQAGLVAYYCFDQGTAGGNNAGLTTVLDSSGNSINGTLNNFALMGSTSNWTFGAPGLPPSVLVVDATLPPVVNNFTATVTPNSTIVSVHIDALDNVAVTHYLITQTNTPPEANNLNWSSAPPTTYDVHGFGPYNLYPWVKDAAGNVSAALSSPVTVTTRLVLKSFTATVTPNPTIVSVHIELDNNVGVTHYLITQTNTPPEANNQDWSSVPPTTYDVHGFGPYSLYLWIKDVEGNISAVFNPPATVTTQQLDVTLPVVNNFAAAPTSNVLDIPITAFTASDNIAVAGYKITTSATPPAAGDAGWSTTPPGTHRVGGYREYKLYPWVKDAAGNVSAVFNLPVTVTTRLVLKSFTATVTPNATIVSVHIELDNNDGVTHYLITQTNTPPEANNNWSSALPTTYDVHGFGPYSLYLWIKDVDGNISAVFNPPATVTTQQVAVTVPVVNNPPVTATPSLPSVNRFMATSTPNSLTISIDIDAVNHTALTYYLITETDTRPAVNAAGWRTSAPMTYQVAAFGDYTLYPWVKDAAGNISTLYSNPASVHVVQDSPDILKVSTTLYFDR